MLSPFTKVLLSLCVDCKQQQRLHLQVYSFDKVSIIMDNVKGAIKARIADRWVSVSLEELMEQNTVRKAKFRK